LAIDSVSCVRAATGGEGKGLSARRNLRTSSTACRKERHQARAIIIYIEVRIVSGAFSEDKQSEVTYLEALHLPKISKDTTASFSAILL
jgi:hypothetical protein